MSPYNYRYCYRLLFVAILLCFQAYISHAQPTRLLNKPFAERYKYFNNPFNNNLYNIPKDSITTLIKWAEKNNDKALMYHLVFSDITNKGDITLREEEELIDKIQVAQNEGHVFEAALGYSNLAELLWHNEQKAKALELALKSYDIYHDKPLIAYPAKIYNQRVLANWYYGFGEYEKAKNIMLELVAATKGDINKLRGPGLNTLALIYRQQGQYDSAIYYFDKIYNGHPNEIETEAKALAAGNIGTVYSLKKDYDKAISWMKTELQLWGNSGKKDNLSCFSDYIGIAEMYLYKKDISKAKVYIDSASSISRQVRHNDKIFRLYYNITADILRADGQLDEALKYKDSAMAAMERMTKTYDKTYMLTAEKKVTQAKHEIEKLQLKNQRNKSLMLRNFFVVFILLVSVIIILLINRSRLTYKQQELQALNEKNIAEAKLLSFTSKLHEKNRQLEELEYELKHISDDNATADKNEKIAQLQQSTILTDEQWDEFRHLFEQVYRGYLNRVKEKYPGITPAEIRYLALLKLNLTNKEMANILGVNDSTVRNYKSRIRKKFSIPEDVDFEESIRNI